LIVGILGSYLLPPGCLYISTNTEYGTSAYWTINLAGVLL